MAALVRASKFRNTVVSPHKREYCYDNLKPADGGPVSGAYGQKIAASKGISAEMLMYAFVHAIGIVPISGTTSEKHMAEDVSLMTRKSVFTNQDEEDFVTMSNILQFHDR